MNLLANKTAIVTGASSGIGLATAELFAREGANLVLAARRPEPLEEARKRVAALGASAIAVSADVSKAEDCAAICAAAVKEFGGIDVLVNNAGIVDRHVPAVRCDLDWWREVCAIDQDSVFYMSREALPHMEKREWGSIVNVSSIGGEFGSSGIAYSASKSAVLGITKNIAIQYAAKNIRCNAICPGPTPTGLNTPEAVATFDKEFMAICNKHLNLSIPFTSAQEQANVILFLACPMSSGINGRSIIVDHGITL